MATSDLMDLSGRVVLVTGGNGGIGLGMAEAMAKAGAGVCIWGTNPDKNAAALATLRGHGGKAEAMVCDVTDRAAVEARFADTLDIFGRVDGCFANAGLGLWRRSFLDVSFEDWRRVLDINLDGVFHTFQVALGHMVERAKAGDPFGRLVATSSIASLMGSLGHEHYAASKGAVNSLIEGLAVGNGRWGVTANAILPGWTETEMTGDHFGNDKFTAAVMPRLPIRRWGRPEDFAGIAVYLMSAASSYHTGDCIVIDGGFRLF
ncbi:MAG: SDR family oxidoreductase [Hyphomicrobiales bacterium]|nr:SDR family oxidoreductase [Hyphomicrobiales bacterium]MCP5373324.1 SDR family oxidoreductase [Hyphomicrobiales bacterium]